MREIKYLSYCPNGYMGSNFLGDIFLETLTLGSTNGSQRYPRDLGFSV